MSYCRFENTYKALQECLEELEELGVDGVENEANEREHRYVKMLINLCEEIAERCQADMD